MVYQSDRLDATFAALADPTRRAILARLSAGAETISRIAGRFDMSLPAVSKHIHILERAGLAQLTRDGRARRAGLNAAPLRTALQWIERYRAFWESELDLLARYLEAPSQPDPAWPTKPARPKSKSAVSSARRGNAFSRRGRPPRN